MEIPLYDWRQWWCGLPADYLLATLLVGLPVMIAEITMGRSAKTNLITALQRLAPRGQPWWLIGAFGVVAAF